MKFFFPQLHSLADVQRNFEQIEQQGEFSGNGVPTFSAKKGNRYWRLDDLATPNHRLYVNTADGVNWTGIL